MNTAKQLIASSLGAQPDTYFYALATSVHQSTPTLAVIGSDDTLRISDSADLRLINAVTSCHAGVSCLIASSSVSNAFMTGGRDGLVNLWDPRTHKVALKWADPSQRGISAIACQDNGTYFAAGTESVKEGLGDVSVLVYDIRKSGEAIRNYAESHTDSITQLVFHPGQSELLLSASTDGLVSFLDVNHTDEDDALQQVLNPQSAVHRSGFLSGNEAYVVTTDEHFAIYPLSENTDGSGDPPMDFGDLRPKLNCMYVINIVLLPNIGPVISYGHNEAQTLSVIPIEGFAHARKFGSPLDFPTAHGAEVVRDILFASDQKTAYTCGEDGQVQIWSLPSMGTSSNDCMQIDSPKASRKRRDKKSERYTPY